MYYLIFVTTIGQIFLKCNIINKNIIIKRAKNGFEQKIELRNITLILVIKIEI